MDDDAERIARRDYGKFSVVVGLIACVVFTYWYDVRVGLFAFLGYFVCYFVAIPWRRRRAGMQPPWEDSSPSP